MARQLMHTRALLDVPHTDGAIQRAGDDVLAIELANETLCNAPNERASERVTYDKRVDAIGVTIERVQALLLFGKPHTDGVVVRTGHDIFAIVANAAHGCRVTTEHVQTFTRANIPHTRNDRTKCAETDAAGSVSLPHGCIA